MLNSQLKSFEGLNYTEQVRKIGEELESAGFDKEKCKCRGSVSNTYYVKEDCDIVFGIICNSRQVVQAVVMDKSFYNEQIRGNRRKVTLKSRNSTEQKVLDTADRGRNFVLIFSDVNMPLHRQVMNVKSGDPAIDHVTHSLSICTKEYLRKCTPQQNKYNTACYVGINEKDRCFTAPCQNLGSEERIRYSCQGYTFKKNHIKSPSFSSIAELYRAVDNYEARYLGAFRYKPLYDFSETLYAFVAWKMLGWGSEVEITEYNRDYIIRNHPDVAKYYQLGE